MCISCGCRKARARGLCDRCYAAARRTAMQAGTWQSQSVPMVDGAAAAAHLDALARLGVSRSQVARRWGLNHVALYRIMAGRKVTVRVSRQVLAVPLPRVAHTVVQDRAFVPACGTARRLQALCALGWPLRLLAQRLGDMHLRHLGDVCDGVQEVVMACTARSVQKLYDQLSGTPGPSQQARRLARRRGWAPPLAWADETPCECEGDCSCDANYIDDPQAQPQHLPSCTRCRLVRCTCPTGPVEPRQSFRELYDDLRALGYTSPAQIAARLGITERSLGRELAPSKYGLDDE